MSKSKKTTVGDASKKKKAAKKVKVKAASTKPAAKKTKTQTKVTSAYKIKEGDRAPGFQAEATSGKTIRLEDFKGKTLVLYFYPKDSTPGCTLEGQDFARLLGGFKKANSVVVGVSRDSLSSHEKFREKCGFPFELIADTDGELCGLFDVIQMKKLYGRSFEGIERSTFVISQDGRIAREWRKVKVDGHAQEVLDAVRAL
jgi:thioredoxin-dependent peroxiredoxin